MTLHSNLSQDFMHQFLGVLGRRRRAGGCRGGEGFRPLLPQVLSSSTSASETHAIQNYLPHCLGPKEDFPGVSAAFWKLLGCPT